MKIITAPNFEDTDNDYGNDVTLFLGGGITNCPDWQKGVLGVLKDYDRSHPGVLNNLVVFNPRREKFDMSNRDEAKKQIEWEYNMIRNSKIFSMYFSDGESDQPICMYELGNVLGKYSQDIREYGLYGTKRLVITSNPDYKRHFDVVTQTRLATNGLCSVCESKSLISHAFDILFACKEVQLNMCCKDDPTPVEK